MTSATLHNKRINGSAVLTTASIPVFNTTSATTTTTGWDIIQVRAAPPREFNPYINTSDLLEEFIAFLGDQDVKQRQVMQIPMEYFVKWLVIRACEVDQEEPTVELPALPATKQPRCLGCQRFMGLEVLLPLHGAACAERFFNRSVAVVSDDDGYNT